jgi:hypothetical protein
MNYRALNEEKKERVSPKQSTQKQLNKTYNSPITKKEKKITKKHDDSQNSVYENNLNGDIRYKQYDLNEGIHDVQRLHSKFSSNNETVSIPSISSLALHKTEEKYGSYMRGIYMYIYM